MGLLIPVSAWPRPYDSCCNILFGIPVYPGIYPIPNNCELPQSGTSFIIVRERSFTIRGGGACCFFTLRGGGTCGFFTLSRGGHVVFLTYIMISRTFDANGRKLPNSSTFDVKGRKCQIHELLCR